MKTTAPHHATRWLILAIISFLTLPLLAATYHVDAAKGADDHSGLTPADAWQSLARVNATTFQPSDRILFAAGCRWQGKLNPKGSGKPDKPISIGSFGDGPQPVIDGAGATGDGVVYLHNQQYCEIADLEITNDAPNGGDRCGVKVSAANFGTVHHIHLKNLHIHPIKGIVDQKATEAKNTGAIGIFIEADDKVDTRYHDVLIEDNRLKPGSPCINSGWTIENHGGRDFWGNPVPNAGGTIDCGTHEFDEDANPIKFVPAPTHEAIR